MADCMALSLYRLKERLGCLLMQDLAYLPKQGFHFHWPQRLVRLDTSFSLGALPQLTWRSESVLTDTTFARFQSNMSLVSFSLALLSKFSALISEGTDVAATSSFQSDSKYESNGSSSTRIYRSTNKIFTYERDRCILSFNTIDSGWSSG